MANPKSWTEKPSKPLRDRIAEYNKFAKTGKIDEKFLESYVAICSVAFSDSEYVHDYAFAVSKQAKQMIGEYVYKKTGRTMWQLVKWCYENKVWTPILDLYYAVLLFEAQHHDLDSYMRFLERKRDPKDRFYAPKRAQFWKFGLVPALQAMLDDECDILCISMPPGSGKTTCEKFFTTGVMGWYPKDYNLFYSHSSGITRMYYDGVLDILTNTDEYCWQEIFPGINVTSTNAKEEQINVGKYKPFPSLQTASVGSENAGRVRASKYLLVDDMIGKIEEALNKNILDKLWQAYSVDARQRKVEDSTGKPCKEIHIATRWSVNDIIGRLQRMYEGNPRVRFISIPDIDPKTGESNFDYEVGGFTKEFFADQALLMDDISYRCLYKQDPIEREGLLYHEDDLRYFATEPTGEPDAIWGVCDTKSKGTDFMVLPAMYQYGEDFYMMDCICDDSADFGVQQQRLANLICTHNLQQCEFESNAGGDRLAEEVAQIIKERGSRCNITTKPTETNKETRIIVNSDWVKKHILFRTKDQYTPKSDYGIFMHWLLSYSVAGKNSHDDVCDCMANFALFITNKLNRKPTVVIHSPWS